MSNGRTGASLGGVESSPERRSRQAAKRKREEKRWAKRSGPVTVRFVDPQTLRSGPLQQGSGPVADGNAHNTD